MLSRTLAREVPELESFFKDHPEGKYVGGYNLDVKKFGIEVLDIALNLDKYPDGTYDRETEGWVVFQDGSFKALPRGERVLDSSALHHHEVRSGAVTIREGIQDESREQILCVVVHRYSYPHYHQMTVYVRPEQEVIDRI